MWNDLAFWKKLAIAFGTLLALLIVSVGISVYGINGIQDQNRQAQYANQVHDLFAQKNTDHYRWMTTVDRVLMDGSSSHLGVQTDDRRCKLGAWLYGPERKAAEAAFPGLAPLLKQLERPHARMHQSAKKIDAVLARRGDADSTAVTREAMAIYRSETTVALKDLQRIFDSSLDLLDTAAKQTNDRLTRHGRATKVEILATAGIALVAGVLLSLFMTRYITTRIRKLTQFSQSLAAGDFTTSIDIDQRDEIGMLAVSLDKTRQDLSRMFGSTIDEVVGLSTSSASLFDVSQQLADGARDMTGRSNTVAAAAEEMSSNMNSVAAASEQAATNVNMVATAAEEMSSTVRDIAGNSEKGRTITNEAVVKAETTSAKVNELGDAAAQISKVTEVITEISEQTNLLALNATIEAARAGEAGKGFAVVANEIKELAKQTAEATQDIKSKVEMIQSTTDGTVVEIEQITGVIRSVNDIVGTIAAAVEQQSAATQEIAENVAQASMGIAEVNQNVSQSSAVAAEIARDIAAVSRTSGEINTASDRVNDDAGNLSTAAKRIKEMMHAFKIDASAAAAGSSHEADAVPDLIRWDSRIQLGIKRIDSQHKRLVDLINALNRAMKQRKGREAMSSIFADLVDYTKRHFGDEEQLMRKHGYDGLAEQESQHNHFVKKMADMQSQVNTGNAMLSMDLMEFLKAWLVKHIQGTDKKYQAFFKSKGVL